MEDTSGRGARLPLVVAAILLIAAAAAIWWYVGRPRSDRPGADPSAEVATLAFNASACGTAPNIPAGAWDFPQPAGAVETWVRNKDTARTRTHGWWLWAALNQPVQTAAGLQPLWRGWCTSTQAFAPDVNSASPDDPAAADPAASDPAAGGASAASSHASLGGRRDANNDASAEPIGLPGGPVYPTPRPGVCTKNTPSGPTLRDGTAFANNGDLMIAGVIYNPPAYNSIRSQKLYLQSTLQAQTPMPGGPGIQLAVNSVVLKPMLWPVPGTGYSALPLWDGATVDGGTYAGFERQSLWPRAVAVTAQPGGPPTRDIQYLYNVKQADGKTSWGPITYRKAAIVPINQFYTYRPDVATMDPCDRAILNQSSNAAYNRNFQQGDYLILIAMHIMTKEQTAWTFQSVWWSDRPNQGEPAANRPPIPAAKGPWRNYVMASTYGIPLLQGASAPAKPGQKAPFPVAAKWGIAFNPYIELAADHPIATNCMNCHHRGAFQPKGSTGQANYLTNLPTDPGAIGVLSPNNPILNGLVLTDKQWSLPNRALMLRAPERHASAAGRPKRPR